MVDSVRQLALEILYKIDKEKGFANIILDEYINKNRKMLNNKDIGLISEIVYGVITWELTLDEIIKKYSKIKLKKISPWIINILRMGIYQIIFLNKIPKSAAVNESVNLAKRYGHKASSNFVNAILRKISKKDYEELFEIKNKKEKISKTTSMPEWIVEELLKEKEIKDVEKICMNSNLKPKITIRVNKLKTTKLELEKSLENNKIEFENGLLENFINLKKVKNLENIKEFQKGLFSVQDEGAGLICEILNPQENDIVLDACSAPRRKSNIFG